jgi:phosphohistidine phosphatase
MKRELLLLRHGKSDWNNHDVDFNRPLKDRGKRAAQRVGVWLATNDMIPDYIASSPAERALVTAEKCCKAMELGTEKIQQEEDVYHAHVDTLYEVLHRLPAAAKRVMLVGHNPGLEELLFSLTAGDVGPVKNDKLMPTAALAILESDENWYDLKEGSVRLQRIIYPRTLPKKFPWPLHKAREQRDRPAYYYNQSSVIPYRIQNGKPEILIIRSSKKKHWVTPKGIHEPGLTAQQSAAKEALEEAGVEGSVDKKAVGNYRYQKWGATCNVAVYAMAVSNVIPNKDWEESHRTRQWVTPKEAVSMLGQKELGRIIRSMFK